MAEVPYSVLKFPQQKIALLSTSDVKKKDFNEIHSNPWVRTCRETCEHK